MSTYIEDYVPKKVSARVGQKAVVMNKNGEILVLVRSKKTNRAGGWDLPGGGLDHGEDPLTGIIREIREEAGIEVRDVIPIHVMSETHNDDFLLMIGYSAQALSDEVTVSWEHDSYEWVPLADVLQRDWPAAHRSFLEHAINR